MGETKMGETKTGDTKMEDTQMGQTKPKMKVLVLREDTSHGETLYHRIRIINESCLSCQLQMLLMVVIFPPLVMFILPRKA